MACLLLSLPLQLGYHNCLTGHSTQACMPPGSCFQNQVACACTASVPILSCQENSTQVCMPPGSCCKIQLACTLSEAALCACSPGGKLAFEEVCPIWRLFISDSKQPAHMPHIWQQPASCTCKLTWLPGSSSMGWQHAA